MKKTVIVLGSARTGTSVLAGIVHRLGVDMHPIDNVRDGYPFGSFEDPKFTGLIVKIWNEKRLKPGYVTPPRLRRIIEGLMCARNASSDSWGWKCALTHRVIDSFMHHIENPYFVVIFRNMIYQAESMQRMMSVNYGQKFTYEMALKKCADDVHALANTLHRYSDVPMLFVSHEDICSDINQSAAEVADFLDIALTPKKLKAINELYKK